MLKGGGRRTLSLRLLQQLRERQLAGNPLRLVRLVEQPALRYRLSQSWRQHDGCGLRLGRLRQQRSAAVKLRRLRRLALRGQQLADHAPRWAEFGEGIGDGCAGRCGLACHLSGNDDFCRTVDHYQFEQIAGFGTLGELQRQLFACHQGPVGVVGQGFPNLRGKLLAFLQFG